ncbi:MAG: DNA polymerase I [Bacteroidia bacterium]|nr:DNA polymerase I [Bacteroidia bacterium]MBP7261394.1 DNA polymerase I [Bacteroidia bacterium]MBP9180695.1 DNA polymerase I [Bacteroidia bacterium]MBP9724580.1 DNA polymerase I [Bacteroidia bacterium]
MKTPNDKRLFLLDGMALVYRAYFAFSQNPRITSYGFNTSAIFGYVNTVLDLLKREKPTHIGVSFDTSAPTARHEEYELYKAHRDEQPEDITKALPYIMKITQAMRIPILIRDGFEADDIIGTLAKKAEQKGYDVYMMTPDKDFAQLVSEHIFIYKPARMGNDFEIMGVPEVLQKWSITEVKQVIDILGMWGDAVDNIPGIPGIGEKTAKTLVQKYGSMEGLYENVHELKGKQKENVENNREQAFLSKRLATIDTNVPIELVEEDLLLEEPDKEEVEKLFAELEFKTMAKRLFSNEPQSSAIESKTAGSPAGAFDLFNQGALEGTATATENTEISVETAEVSPQATIHSTPHEYILVEGEDALQHLLQELLQQKEICFDTETSSLDKIDNDIVGFSFSYKAHHGYYIPCPSDYAEAKKILSVFQPVFESENITKICQNIKYDWSILKLYGLSLKGPLFDTMLAHYLIEPDLRHGMDYLSGIYLHYEPVSIEELIGKKGKNQLSMRDVPLEKIKEYAAEDTDITFQLKQKLEPELKEREAEKLLYELEQPLVPVLADMESEGVRINKQFLNDYSVELQTEIAQLEKRILELAGVNFNISSPKQLGEVLFDHLKLDPKAKKTKTGQYQTGEDVLQGLSEHEIVRCILEIRQLQKLKSTYVDSLPELINATTGRVHTSFNQAVAATGRLSSNNPNLQNIPIRTDKGREVRKAFIARNEDYVLLSADYSQIELRIVASISEEENMIAAFKQGLDIHTATAAKVYGVSVEEVTSQQRRNAKAVNFGIIYGQSAFGLSQSLGIPRKEAATIIEEYFKQYPNIKSYMNNTINFAKEHGYVQTLMGRRRYLRDINSANFTVRGFAERNAINAPIQGSAADMIKVAMIKIYNRMQKETNLKSKMILQVHDELLFDVHKTEIEHMKTLVKEEMESAMSLKVPVVAEAGVGDNWLVAH